VIVLFQMCKSFAVNQSVTRWNHKGGRSFLSARFGDECSRLRQITAYSGKAVGLGLALLKLTGVGVNRILFGALAGTMAIREEWLGNWRETRFASTSLRGAGFDSSVPSAFRSAPMRTSWGLKSILGMMCGTEGGACFSFRSSSGKAFPASDVPRPARI